MKPIAHASFGFVFETSIGVSGKNHVTCVIGDAVIGVGGYAVEELFGRGVGEIGCSSLLDTERNEANEELVVNCTSIVEEGANYSLDKFDVFIVKERSGVRGRGELRLVTVLDIAVPVGQDLRLGGILVAVFYEEGFNVTIHSEEDLSFRHVKDIRPVEVDAQELVA